MLHKNNQIPISDYSKGSWGLSVLPQVSGIFTGITTSPRSTLRQCRHRYTIRAGRNLPDKEFRYLRTVGHVSLHIHPLTSWHRAVFLLNSRTGLFIATALSSGSKSLHQRRHPLFRSYGANLPSSLTLVSLAHLRLLASPTCVGLRYGYPVIIV